ncbi:hypothetical protein AU194_25430 [Mycobacterium sp. GA-2829]|nr:hypothetical protein AU194_25430 [Mycobacterium sp. GA-2829]
MPDFPRRPFNGSPNGSANGGEPSLPEINYTDRLLDALAGEQPVYANDSAEAELTYLLAGWRDEVRRPTMSAVLTPRDAAIALDRSTTTTHRRRFSLAVVGSLAAAVLCLGGFGSVVYGAGPGDPLYGVRTMLFGEQHATRDDQVALAAQTQMAQVQQLIDQGDWTAAQDKLQTLTTTVAAVGDTGRQQELVEQWQQLSVKVETRDPAATVPPDAPPVVLPEVPSDIPLPALLGPDATSPSDSTTPSRPPSSTDPSATSPSSSAPETSPSSIPPSETPPSSPQPTTTSPPAPSPTPSTAPTSAPSSSAPVQLPPPSSGVTAPEPTSAAATTPATTAGTTSAAKPTPTPGTTAAAPPVVEEEAPAQSAPSVEQTRISVPATTTTVVLPAPGAAAVEEE